MWKNYIFLSLGETVTDDECQQFILDADQDGDGKINYEEFYNMMSQKLYWNAFKNLKIYSKCVTDILFKVPR